MLATAVSVQSIRALAAQLVTPELIVFPVRHHSPACAFELHRLMQRVRPAVVLVEGPRSFSPLIPLLVHPEARTPLAIYTYAVHKAVGDETPERHSAYYPFCDYSPELVALRAAHAQGIPARFIDLDYAEQRQLDTAAAEEESHSLLAEQHLKRSRHLHLLAERLGCRDHEELWEHLFEVPAAGRTLEQLVAELVAYCQLARADCSDAELAADGTLQREEEMAWHVREALAARKPDEGPVLAIMGGFHTVVMPQLLATARPRPQVSRAKTSDEGNALIRFSFDRLDRLNGYSAGMTSPAWHQELWERGLRLSKVSAESATRSRQDTALDLLHRLAQELREKHGVQLPLPALQAAYEHVLQLARLRRRPAPVRDDWLDAVRSCFVKGEIDGDGALVMIAARRLIGGQAMGRVPPGAGTPPLVRDFEFRARKQRLKIDDAEPRRAVLDIYRRAEHRTTSRLLHGLVLLGIPFAMRTAGPDFVNGTGLDRLQEHWEYAHSAATEAALVEAAVYGVTVPLAVANRFAVHLQQLSAGADANNARVASSLVAQACVLGLHDHLPRVMALLRRAIAADAAFDSVAAATGTLGLLWESREPLEARDVPELLPLLQAAFERAIYLARGLQGVQGDGSSTVAALSRLRELLVSQAGAHLDSDLFWQVVEALHARHDRPLIRGACAGLLYAAGRVAEEQLAVAVEGHLKGLALPKESVGFLRGLFATGREAAWQQPALLRVLDGLLGSWDENMFVGLLPELRLAFAEMTPKETDRIAESVAQLHGREDLGRLMLHDTSEAQMQAHLQVSTRLMDVLAEDGLLQWVSP